MRALVVAGLVCFASAGAAWHTVGGLAQQPGALTVLGVALSGLALAAACFHAVRIRAARQAGRTGLAADDVNAHLDIVDRFEQRRSASAPRAARGSCRA